MMTAEPPVHQIDSNVPSFKPRMTSNGGGGDRNTDRFVSFRNFLAVNSAHNPQSPKHYTFPSQRINQSQKLAIYGNANLSR